MKPFSQACRTQVVGHFPTYPSSYPAFPRNPFYLTCSRPFVPPPP